MLELLIFFVYGFVTAEVAYRWHWTMIQWLVVTYGSIVLMWFVARAV